MGVFLVDTSKGFKLGYSTDIQFSVNKDYYVFKTLEAVSLIDNTVSRSEYVEFTVDTKKSDIENGIYTIKVKVLKATNDILVRPVCIPYPVVTSYSPSSVAEAHFANEAIQITFNIPMEAEDVSKEDSIFNFRTNNIQLTCNGNSVIQYFETPVFNKEKTVLTIAPKGPELKKSIKTAYIDVQVYIKDNLTISQDDVQLPFKQNEMSNFTVRYKPEIEEVKPQIDSLFVTRKEYSIEEAKNLSSDYKFSEGEVGTYDSNKVNQNKTRDTIYIYGSCYDADSGVKEIEVIEQRRKDYKGKTVTEYAKKTVPYTQDNSVFETKDGTTEFCIEHKLQADDGLIQLTVICYDACNNFVEYTGEINVVKKSSIQFYSDGDISIENHPGIDIDSEESIEQFNSNLNKLRVYAGYSGGSFGHSGWADCVIYGNVCTDPAVLTLNLKYTDKDNVLHDEDFEYFDITDPDDIYQWYPIGWTLDLKNIDTVSGMKLYFTISDDLGNTYEKTFAFLSEPSLIFGRKQYKQGSSNYYGTFASYVFDSGVLTKQVSLIEKNTTNNAITKQYVTQSDTNAYDVLIPSSYCEYRLMFANNGLFSPIGTQTFKQSDYNSTGLETIYLETDGYPKVEKSSKDGYLDITVKLYETQSENLWDSYDSFFIEYAGETIANFEPQSQTCKFQLNTYNCFRVDQPFTVYGVKDKSFNYYSATLPKVTDVSKDNAPPRFYRDPALWEMSNGSIFPDHHNCEIKVWDRESGISKVYVITKDNKEILLYNNPAGFKNDPSDGYFNDQVLCVNIPLSYIMSNHIMINGNAYVNIGVEDAQGNKTQSYAISEVLDPIWTEIKLNSGLYDLMIPNGNSNTSFAISSDAPVYVYTLHLRRSTDYSSWTLKDWEDHMEHYGYDPYVEECGFTYLDFSDSDYTPKRYNVPADVVETGDPYCVVVHFFDGSVLTSGVID